MDRIPFTLPDINYGLTEITGFLYLEQEFLVFEVETAVFGEFDKEQRIIKVEPSALEAVYLERGWLKDQLLIRPKKRELLEALPGDFASEVPLKIKRKHRRKTERLASILRKRAKRQSIL